MRRQERDLRIERNNLLSRRSYRLLEAAGSISGTAAIPSFFLELLGATEVPRGVAGTVGVALLGVWTYTSAKLIKHNRAVRRLDDAVTAPFIYPSPN